MTISVNRHAMQILKEVVSRRDELRIKVEKRQKGGTIIDAGLNVSGGYAAGVMAVRLCMAGLGAVSLSSRTYGDFELPTVTVATDQPSISAFGAQLAGWDIKVGDYIGMGSGPARALALKPKDIYEEIDYRDKSDLAVMVLESDRLPPDDVIAHIASECGVRPWKVYAFVTPTNSIAGSVQVSGRIVEIGMYKLRRLGLHPNKILCALGSAPIATIHPKSTNAMGRTNDALYYGGETHYAVEFDDDEQLKEIVSKAPSSTAGEYGKPFSEIFKSAGFDFYKIDPNLFAPAVVSVTNVKTGLTYRSGRTNASLLKESMNVAVV